MVIRTGKGAVSLFSQSPIRVFLYNFDIEDTTLKMEHKLWLNDNILKMVAEQVTNTNTVWMVDIEGRTSRSGSDHFNFGLSVRRSDNVLKYLKSNILNSNVKFSSRGVGESHSLHSDSTEYAIDRSVFLTVTAKTKTVPPPPPPNIAPKMQMPPTKHFKLRVANWLNASIGLPVKLSAGPAKDTAVIEICDLQTNMTGIYQYDSAFGASGGLAISLPVSGSIQPFAGPSNCFNAPSDVTFKDFEGIAALTSTQICIVMCPPELSLPTTFGFGGPVSKWGLALRFKIKDLQVGTTGGTSVGLQRNETMGEMKLIGVKHGCF